MDERVPWYDAWGLPAARFAVIVLIALVVRLAAGLLPGHNGDTSIESGWAESLAARGPSSFFESNLSVYPGLLYVLWPLGVAFDPPQLDAILKILSIPFDVALAVLLVVVTRQVAPVSGNTHAFAASALYLFNPAVLIAGPVWGQVDAAGTLVFVAALLAAARGRSATAAGLGVLAGMLKPQFGLVLLPVLTVAVMRALRQRSRVPVLRSVAAGLAVYVLIAAPLQLDPGRYWYELTQVANHQPFASSFAPNPWGLLFGFETPESGFGLLGGALFVFGLGLAVLPVIRRSDLAALLAGGAFVIFAFYFLPTRVHERYLFPALAVLAPLAVNNRYRLAAYFLLSIAFSISLLNALVHITPFQLPPSLQEILVAQPSVWAVGVGLMVAAAAWILLLWRDLWRIPARQVARGSSVELQPPSSSRT